MCVALPASRVPSLRVFCEVCPKCSVSLCGGRRCCSKRFGVRGVLPARGSSLTFGGSARPWSLAEPAGSLARRLVLPSRWICLSPCHSRVKTLSLLFQPGCTSLVRGSAAQSRVVLVPRFSRPGGRPPALAAGGRQQAPGAALPLWALPPAPVRPERCQAWGWRVATAFFYIYRGDRIYFLF